MTETQLALYQLGSYGTHFRHQCVEEGLTERVGVAFVENLGTEVGRMSIVVGRCRDAMVQAMEKML